MTRRLQARVQVRSPMTRRLRALALILMLCAVTACVRLPESGPVTAGTSLDESDDVAPPINAPGEPRPGADPEEIVSTFLQAMGGYPQTLDVARDYLTAQADANWEPQRRTLIMTDRTVSLLGPGRVVLSGTEVGTLSQRGSWSSAGFGGVSYRREFTLVRDGGEWRIANPPQALVISNDYFDRYYQAYSLYFPDPTDHILVPDPIYLESGPQTPTLLAQGLLRGPTPWLVGAVRQIVPATNVGLSVPVSNAGVAEVPLSDVVLGLGPDDRISLLAEFVWTLAQVPGISAVRLTAGGGPFEVGGSTNPVPINSFPGYDPAGLTASGQLFGLSGGRLVAIDDTGVAAVGGPYGESLNNVSSLAIDTQAEHVAVVNAARSSVRVAELSPSDPAAPNRPATWYSGGEALLRPVWDLTGQLWIVDDTRQGARLIAIRPDHSVHEYSVPGLTGQNVQAFRISRDGVRLATVVDTGSGDRLQVSRIVRNGTGAVVRVDHTAAVTNSDIRFTDILDIGWSTPTSLAVLARVENATPEPYTVAIDGSDIVLSTGLPNIGAQTVASSPNHPAPLVIGSRSGSLWVRRSDLRWARTAPSQPVWLPTYPG